MVDPADVALARAERWRRRGPARTWASRSRRSPVEGPGPPRRPLAPRRRSWPGSPACRARTATRSARSRASRPEADHPRTPRSRRPRRRASTDRTGSPGSPDRRGDSPRPSVRSPSNTSLVETRSIDAPASAQARASTRVASPLRRMASSGSRAQPSTSVQAAAWMTRSGRSAAIRPATGSGCVEVELGARPRQDIEQAAVLARRTTSRRGRIRAARPHR